MGAARRNARRKAREAAKQLLDSGIPASAIADYADLERDKRFLGKIVEAAEKALDGAESKVSLREGLAAVKERRALRDQQLEIAERSPDAEDLDPEPVPLPHTAEIQAAPGGAASETKVQGAATNSSGRAA